MINLWEFKGCVKIWQKYEITMKMMRMIRKIGRWKNVEEIKLWQIFTYESRNFKKDMTKQKEDNMTKNGQKENKKRTKIWKDDEMMTHRKYRHLELQCKHG